MKKMIAGSIAAIALLAFFPAGSLVAHHSLAQFDTTTAVKVKGTIVLVQRVNPHSFIFLDQTGKDGKRERWAIEGPGILQLTRMGIETDTLKVGDVLEACGFVPKEGVEPQRSMVMSPVSENLKQTAPKNMSGRLLTAEMLVMPDGKTQRWSDYGQHLCLGPDYRDMHLR